MVTDFISAGWQSGFSTALFPSRCQSDRSTANIFLFLKVFFFPPLPLFVLLSQNPAEQGERAARELRESVKPIAQRQTPRWKKQREGLHGAPG